jgi:hypothetical protein
MNPTGQVSTTNDTICVIEKIFVFKIRKDYRLPYESARRPFHWFG